MKNILLIGAAIAATSAGIIACDMGAFETEREMPPRRTHNVRVSNGAMTAAFAKANQSAKDVPHLAETHSCDRLMRWYGAPRMKVLVPGRTSLVDQMRHETGMQTVWREVALIPMMDGVIQTPDEEASQRVFEGDVVDALMHCSARGADEEAADEEIDVEHLWE